MNTPLPVDPSITDMSQFSRLRAAAQRHDPQALRAVARQFEALFTQQLLKSMRQAKVGDDLMGSQQADMYQGMYDQQLAQKMAQGHGLGIADLLVRQLQGEQTHPTADKAAVSAPTALQTERKFFPLAAGAGAAHFVKLPTAGKIPLAPLKMSATLSATTPAEVPLRAAQPQPSVSLAHPADFIKSLLPQAQAAARELGVPARVLVAQAALETGWGKHMIKNADGSPSYNFFGIKAGRHWQGDKVSKSTTEYHGSQPQREVAQFRSYDTPAAAFKDYVKFLKSNPRYAAALNHGGDTGHFARGLQQAGYATDPAYAEKICRISSGPTMRLVLTQASATQVA
ncbi:MAG: flagellar assembly peptidoglycan hydrolase FlgJ [Stenotrophobium sp.]